MFHWNCRFDVLFIANGWPYIRCSIYCRMDRPTMRCSIYCRINSLTIRWSIYYRMDGPTIRCSMYCRIYGPTIGQDGIDTGDCQDSGYYRYSLGKFPRSSAYFLLLLTPPHSPTPPPSWQVGERQRRNNRLK